MSEITWGESGDGFNDGVPKALAVVLPSVTHKVRVGVTSRAAPHQSKDHQPPDKDGHTLPMIATMPSDADMNAPWTTWHGSMSDVLYATTARRAVVCCGNDARVDLWASPSSLPWSEELEELQQTVGSQYGRKPEGGTCSRIDMGLGRNKERIMAECWRRTVMVRPISMPMLTMMAQSISPTERTKALYGKV